MTTAAHVHGCTTYMSILTSAYGPVVTPAYIAVSHSETTDALWALQFITFVAGEMHRGSSPAVRLHTEKKHIGITNLPCKKKTPLSSGSAHGVRVPRKNVHCWRKNIYTFQDFAGVISKSAAWWEANVAHLSVLQLTTDRDNSSDRNETL